jgi:hypothetical protein
MPPGSAQDINWDAPAGRLLQQFFAGLPKDRAYVVNVFGSAALQLKLAPSFLSGDVDIFSSEDLTGLVARMGLGKGQSYPYIEVVPAHVFIATPVWRERADKIKFPGVTVFIASPIDVLVGKMRRLDPKDLNAFDLVRETTGGPSEAALKAALQGVVDMYRPAFDEENPGGDPAANTRRLWLHLYGHDIDVRREIVAPGLAARRAACGLDAPPAIEKLRACLPDGTETIFSP